MTDHRARYGPHNPDATYVAHGIAEHLVDLGEVQVNYATLGDASSPALLLIPGQTESWWGYEAAMPLLAEHFQVFAVDLRGQGRSTRTPGRYTLDNMGNDLVRFMDLVVRRPTIVSGLSSGGVLTAWLSAYAKPGQVIAALYEDPPLFASEIRPAIGPGAVHPPDVAGVLGAHVARASPADARVLLRHHPGRGRPGAHRNHRQAPRDRVPHPARRGDAADGRRPGGVFSRLLAVDPAVDVLRDLGRLHFDLAGFPVPRQLDALLTLTTLEHLHYGSDYPFTPEFAAAMARERLAKAGDPSESLLDALRANTERLFPTLGIHRS